MINFHLLNEDDYKDLRYQVLKHTEGIKLRVYNDTRGIPTIGIGFNLRDTVMGPAVFEEFGVTDRDSQDRLKTAVRNDYATDDALRRALNTIMAELYAAGRANRSQFEFSSGLATQETEMREVLNKAITLEPNSATGRKGEYEQRVDNWLADIPLSRERAAFISLAYNGLINTGTSSTLRRAIASGDRAEAWYQIRYNSNRLGKVVVSGATMSAADQRAYNQGEDIGLAKRRYHEAQEIGLYDNPQAPTLVEINQIFAMFNTHRSYIAGYDAFYGVTFAGEMGTRKVRQSNLPPLLAANQDYNLTGGSVVKNINEALRPAVDYVWANLIDEDSKQIITAAIPGFDPSSILPVDWLVAYDDGTSAANNLLRVLDASTHNDTRKKLLLGTHRQGATLKGTAQQDILIGGRGNDQLFSNGGNDVMIGGDGNDTYYVKSNTRVTIHDSDRKGSIVIDGQPGISLAASGVFMCQTGTDNIWINSQGLKIIYTLPESGGNEDPLKIETPDGGEVLVRNFQNGDFGIRLQKETWPVQPETVTTVVGTDQDDVDTNPSTNPVYHDLQAGTDQNTRIRGLGGNDYLWGRGGQDILEGNAGLDTLSGGSNDDWLFAGDATSDIKAAILAGEGVTPPGEHPDLWKQSEGEWLDGESGNDVLIGAATNDVLLGGSGNDILVGGFGDDLLAGDKTGTFWDSSTNWKLEGRIAWSAEDNTNVYQITGPWQSVTGGDDRIYAGAGNDVVMGGEGDDYVDAGSGNDVVWGGTGSDVILGGEGDDYLHGENGPLAKETSQDGNDWIDGGKGNDYISGSGGDDQLFGGEGDDSMISGGGGDDYLSGDAGNDSIWGGDGVDVIFGGDGSDNLSGEKGRDFISGGDGKDYLFGGEDDDTLFGETGNDELYGGTGSDYLDGGDGDDSLLGGEDSGNDILDGGKGNDYLAGESGFDTYILRRAEMLAGDQDTIVDSDGQGKLLIDGQTLTGADFTAVAPGMWKSGDIGCSFTDGKLTFRCLNESGQYSAGYVVINNFQYGQLGLNLPVYDPDADNGEGNNPTNRPPQVGLHPNVVSAEADTALSVTLPDTLFSDPDGDPLTWTLTLADDTPLPAWLVFDAETHTLSGMPAAANIGLLELKVGVSDLKQDGTSSGTAWQVFSLAVRAAGTPDPYAPGGSNPDNHPPQAWGNLTVASARAGRPWTWALPGGAFTDQDSGDTLAYSATLADGNPLPSWLAIDPQTGSLSGTPATSGNLSIRITATDSDQAKAIQTLSIEIVASTSVNTITGTNGNDTLNGTADDDLIIGLAGNDRLDGVDGNDELLGNEGNDTLFGGKGNDRLEGGHGNDILSGDEGDDEYVFNPGDGQDSLLDTRGNNTVYFGPGIRLGDFKLGFGDLGQRVLYYSDNDSIRILENAEGTTANTYVFADGSRYTHTQLMAEIRTFLGTDQADSIKGSDGADTLLGFDGDDDLTGKRGNDLMKGGNGSDVYFLNLIDGRDTIIDEPDQNNVIMFGPGITIDQMSARQRIDSQGDEYLVIDYGSFGDQVAIKNGLQGTISTFVVQTEYASTRNYSFAELLPQILADGTVFSSTPGNQVLRGGKGTDTYTLARGGGTDTVIDTSSLNTIALGSGLAIADLTALRMGNDLQVRLKDSDDALIIKDYYGISGQVWNLALASGQSCLLSDVISQAAGHADPGASRTPLEERIGVYRDAFMDSLKSDLQARNHTGELLETPTVTTSSNDAEIYAQAYPWSEQIGTRLETRWERYLETTRNPVYQFQPVSEVPPPDYEQRLPYGGSLSQPDSPWQVIQDPNDPDKYIGGYLYLVGHSNVETWKTRRITVEVPVYKYFQPIEIIEGGDGENKIFLDPVSMGPFGDQRIQARIVDAGAGNDYIVGSKYEGGAGHLVTIYPWANFSGSTFGGIQPDPYGGSWSGALPQSENARLRPDNFLYGGDGDDMIVAANSSGNTDSGLLPPGNDILLGGRGNDRENGGNGSDTYIVISDDDQGWDTLFDSGAWTGYGYTTGFPKPTDTVQFDEYVKLEDLHLDLSLSDDPELNGRQMLDISWGNSAGIHVVLAGDSDPAGVGIEQFQFADGRIVSLAQMLARMQGENQTPVVGTVAANQNGQAGTAFTYTLPATLFTDPDGDTLTYTVKQASGDALPAWLTFNADTRTLSGTPTESDIGNLSLKVTVTDPGGLTAAQTFGLAIETAASGEYHLITGTPGPDTLTGTAAADRILGLGSNDLLYGQGGNDRLEGDDGDDTLDGGDGNDLLYGGAGNDYLFGLDGDDTLDGGDGHDLLVGGEGNDYLFGLAGNDRLEGGNGNDLLDGGDGDDFLFGQAGDYDHLLGGNGNDRLEGGNGIDRLEGGNGNDTLDGGEGNDELLGEAGDDYLFGQAGNDIMNGGSGHDVLLGGAGDDILDGAEGNDFLYGQTGNDIYRGGNGNDTYRFNLGDGQDTIGIVYDTRPGRLSTLEFNPGILPGNIRLAREGDNLIITYDQGSDRITVQDLFRDNNPGNPGNPVQHLQFADGTVYDTRKIEQLLGLSPTVTGATITQAGTDGNDTLTGTAERDILYGDTGNDRLAGGAGNDILIGGGGSDTYVFGRGDGQDTLCNYDMTADRNDVLEFGSGIDKSQLWFRRQGSDLEVSIVGTQDTATIRNWYIDESHRLDSFKVSSGLALLENQVDQLVSAMAAFDPPAAGQTTLPPNYQDALNAVIAAGWK